MHKSKTDLMLIYWVTVHTHNGEKGMLEMNGHTQSPLEMYILARLTAIHKNEKPQVHLSVTQQDIFLLILKRATKCAKMIFFGTEL